MMIKFIWENVIKTIISLQINTEKIIEKKFDFIRSLTFVLVWSMIGLL